MAQWLVRCTLERAVWVRALARVTVLCSWARQYSLSASLFLDVSMGTSEFKLGEREKKYSLSLHAAETGTSSGKLFNTKI